MDIATIKREVHPDFLPLLLLIFPPLSLWLLGVQSVWSRARALFPAWLLEAEADSPAALGRASGLASHPVPLLPGPHDAALSVWGQPRHVLGARFEDGPLQVRAPLDHVLKAARDHHAAEVLGHELEAVALEFCRVVLLRERQRRRRVRDVDRLTQMLLADGAQAGQLEPVRRRQQVLRHGDLQVVSGNLRGKRVRVHKVQEDLERGGPHVVDVDGVLLPFPHVVVEKGLEDGRARGHNQPVRRHLLPLDHELEVAALARPQQLSEVLAQPRLGNLHRRQSHLLVAAAKGAPRHHHQLNLVLDLDGVVQQIPRVWILQDIALDELPVPVAVPCVGVLAGATDLDRSLLSPPSLGDVPPSPGLVDQREVVESPHDLAFARLHDAEGL
mmetsp:Transcript_31327/g.67518  ORF Transcript_31327/g.67518 Transcript_31327/m.67518 type:complete len:386 (+) Transcript_31327:547-1704(+)